MTEGDAYRLAYGAVLAQLRGARSQGELAERAALGQSMLSRIERGAAAPSAWTHRQLAAALDLDGAALAAKVERTCQRAAAVVTQLAAAGLVQAADPWYLVTGDPAGLGGLIRFVAALPDDDTKSGCTDSALGL